MAPIADLAAQLWGGIPALFAGPLDDVSSLIFYREIQSYLNDEFQAFGVRLFARMMEWAGAISLTLLTLWIILHGYRITTGQSRDSMAVFVPDMAKAIAVISAATGTAIAGGTLYDWVCNQLPNQINRLVADHDGDLHATIDRTFGYMQLGLSSIGDILSADNALLEAAKTRNQGFVIAGTGMPALVAGALLLFYQAMLAMIVGFAPLGVLSLLFKRTESFFWNWLLSLLSTLVAMAVLSVMAAYLLDVVCAVAASFWAGKLMGSNPEGINSLALQQGGLGLIFTTLMIAVPPAIARIFKGLLGDFIPHSAFGTGWSAPFARNTHAQEHADSPAHTHAGERAHAPVPTHAHRVVAPVQAQADEVKQAADARSFSERYPNALVSLDGHGSDGTPAPASLYENAHAIKPYQANEIVLIRTERATNEHSGITSERHKQLTPGSEEYERAMQALPPGAIDAVTNAVNCLGMKLESRGKSEEIETFNLIKTVAIEVNPSRAHDATYSAKGIHSEGMLLFNPEVFLEMQPLRQNNRAAHEFRHLMETNNDLLRNSTDKHAWKSSYEKDAEAYARELFGDESR